MTIRDEIARIDEMIADTRRKSQEYAPWLAFVVICMVAAAFFAAGALAIRLWGG
jgi:hypothetical protein